MCFHFYDDNNPYTELILVRENLRSVEFINHLSGVEYPIVIKWNSPFHGIRPRMYTRTDCVLT